MVKDYEEGEVKGKTRSKIKKALVKAGKVAGKRFKSAMTEENVKKGLRQLKSGAKSTAKQIQEGRKKIGEGWTTVQKTAGELNENFTNTHDLLGFGDVSVQRKKEVPKKKIRLRSVSSIIFGEEDED